MHEVACLMLETMVTYDQLAVANLASAEQLGRQVQLVEERWEDLFCLPDTASEADQNQHIFMGARQSHICVCPALQGYIAEELRKEASVSEERRKAREERQLTKPKK